MQKNVVSERVKLVGLTEIFKPFEPCAYYISQLRTIIVATKDCSYVAERINGWAEVHWEHYRPWYAPWKKCVGFSVYLPELVRFPEPQPRVTIALDHIAHIALFLDPNPFGEYREKFYRMARNLTFEFSSE